MKKFLILTILLIAFYNACPAGQFGDSEVNESIKPDSSSTTDSTNEPYIPRITIRSGLGRHFWDFSYKYSGVNGYSWNLNVEWTLNNSHSWAIEGSFFKFIKNYNLHPYYGSNQPSYITPEDLYSIVVKYYFSFFGNSFFPSIHLGNAGIIMFSVDLGASIDYRIFDYMNIGASFRKIGRATFEDEIYSPFIVNLYFSYLFELK